MARARDRLATRLERRRDRGGLAVLALALASALGACSIDSATNHYILAEKLWADGKYQAAVAEFDRVSKRDPKGKLGLQALLRSANTEAIFLKNYPGAISKFRQFTEISENTNEILAVERQIGEILFTQLEQYKEAIQQYEQLLGKDVESDDRPKYLFRIGKSHFFLWNFEQAIATYERVQKEFPGTPWAEKAAFEIGLTHFTRGGHVRNTEDGAEVPDAKAYDKAIAAYESFIRKYPNSELVPRAHYGIASCYEELDQLEVAEKKYQEIEKTYPSPSVIQIKLMRIRERMDRAAAADAPSKPR